MTTDEFQSLKPGDIIYVRDFGSPNLVRRVAFYEDITARDDIFPGTCVYLQPDGSMQMQSILGKMKPTVVYFTLKESALTEEGVIDLLGDQYEKARSYAAADLERITELLRRLDIKPA